MKFLVEPLEVLESESYFQININFLSVVRNYNLKTERLLIKGSKENIEALLTSVIEEINEWGLNDSIPSLEINDVTLTKPIDSLRSFNSGSFFSYAKISSIYYIENHQKYKVTYYE